MRTARKSIIPLLALAAIFALASLTPAEDIALRIQTDSVANTISPLIYGQFLEHIYHSGDNGLWGEMVQNRSFEDLGQDVGAWSVKDGVISETAMAEGARLFFGDPDWTDYEFTLQARKNKGSEGFMIIPKGTEGDWLWANLGGWNNTANQLLYVGAQNAEVGPRASGKIDTDHWYSVRVRCQGKHIQLWLDGQSAIDATLPEGINPPGGVGIATWNTAADFKDFKVTDLTGKVLFQGIPKVPGIDGPGRNWQTFGVGKAELVKGSAFNDEFALHFQSLATGSFPSNGSAWAGISQDNFSLKKGETYKGSLYLKGKTGPAPIIRFTSGERVIAEIPLATPADAWKQYRFQFTASQDAPDATLRIAIPPGSDVMLDQVSMMSQSTIKNDGFRPDLYQALADLKPTVIRWPGGIYAEQYHWKNGIGPQTARKKNITPAWNDYDPNALGTDEFITLCRKLGAEPLIVINSGFHVTGGSTKADWQPWIDEARDWVEYCNAPAVSTWGIQRDKNGNTSPYHVKYWEIDNELWRSLQTSPDIYGRAVIEFAKAMKAVDPEIQIIAHGGNATDRAYDQTLLNRAASSMNFLSIHHYTDADKFASGVADQDALYGDLVNMIAGSKNGFIQLDVSEWNCQTIDWRTGLYAGGLLNTFEKYGKNLTIAGPALLFRHTSATAWDNAFINFDHKSWFPAPNYVVMKLWREHFAPTRLTIQGAPPIGRLNIIATQTTPADKIYLKAVNPTDAPANVTAQLQGPFAAAGATFELIAPGSLSAANSMAKPDAVKPQSAPVTAEKDTIKFTLPPYSAGVVTINKNK